MEQPAESINQPDQALVHQFIRLFGRAPSADELTRFANTRVQRPRPRGLRRGMARLIMRL